MKIWGTAVAAVVLASLVSGCGGGGDGAKATATVSVTTTVTTTVTPSAAEEEPAAAVAKLGQAQKAPFGTIKVLEVNPNVTTDLTVMDGLGQERWAGALVRTCVAKGYTDEAIKPSWGPWTITDKADGVYESLYGTTGPNYPQPMYPQLGDRTTKPGACVQGWIVFAVSSGSKLTTVTYEGASVPEPLEWKL